MSGDPGARGRDGGGLRDQLALVEVEGESRRVNIGLRWFCLLRDDRKAPTALNVLDRCRIRWGDSGFRAG